MMMAQREVSFECGSADRIAAGKIATRYRKLVWRHGAEPRSRVEIQMDLIATHANGCPMNFHRLWQADDFNLIHDVGGIERHLDRDTGKLLNCFLPRCHAKDQVPA